MTARETLSQIVNLSVKENDRTENQDENKKTEGTA